MLINTNTNKYKYYLQIQTQIQTNTPFLLPGNRTFYWPTLLVEGNKEEEGGCQDKLFDPSRVHQVRTPSIHFRAVLILISNFKSSFLFVLSMCPCRGVGRMPITVCTKKCRGDLKYYTTAGKSHDRINGAYSILSTKLLVRFSANLVPFLICTANHCFGATHD